VDSRQSLEWQNGLCTLAGLHGGDGGDDSLARTRPQQARGRREVPRKEAAAVHGLRQCHGQSTCWDADFVSIDNMAERHWNEHVNAPTQFVGDTYYDDSLLGE
jgi:hypothetical protein